jgi:hypothetical protein
LGHVVAYETEKSAKMCGIFSLSELLYHMYGKRPVALEFYFVKPLVDGRFVQEILRRLGLAVDIVRDVFPSPLQGRLNVYYMSVLDTRAQYRPVSCSLRRQIGEPF